MRNAPCHPTSTGINSTRPGTPLNARFVKASANHCNTLFVFLHGIAGSHAAWLPAFNTLASEGHLLYIDCLGFGRSPRPDGPYTVDAHIEALQATLRHWLDQLPQPADQTVDERITPTNTTATTATTGAQQHQTHRIILIGHSMGALLAANWALRLHTEYQPPTTDPSGTDHAQHASPQIRIAAVVLASLPIFHNETDAVGLVGNSSVFNRWMALETPLARATCWLMCRLRPVLTPLMPHFLPDLPPEVARDSLQHSWASYSRTLRQVVLRSDGAQLLRQLVSSGLPLLTLHGRNDLLAPASRLQTLLDGQPANASVQCHWLPGGHDIVFTHAHDMAQVIGQFTRSPAH